MFNYGQMGIVIEKEPQVVCVYGTTADYKILCAVPLCHPKYLNGFEYSIEFTDRQYAKISVGEQLKIVIDFANQKCANNKDAACYGSDAWGQDVTLPWTNILWH